MSQSQTISRNRPPANKAAGYRRARPTTAQGPRFGVFAATAFHAAIFAAAFLTWQQNFKTPEETHAVPVDLVTIAPLTNVAAQSPAPPAPEKITIPTAAAPEMPEPQLPDAEPAPDAVMPKFDVEKPKPPEPEKPPQKTVKQQNQDFNDILKNLTAATSPSKTKPGKRTIQAAGLGNAMSASLVDSLRSQISRCYSLQASPPNPADAIVDYDVHLTRDGRVASAELLTRSNSPYTRAGAEAASRALYSCQPYRLPPESYDTWSQINPLHFDPREMLQ